MDLSISRLGCPSTWLQESIRVDPNVLNRAAFRITLSL